MISRGVPIEKQAQQRQSAAIAEGQAETESEDASSYDEPARPFLLALRDPCHHAAAVCDPPGEADREIANSNPADQRRDWLRRAIDENCGSGGPVRGADDFDYVHRQGKSAK